MRKYLVLLLFVLSLSLSSFAQNITTNGKSFVYCTLVGTASAFSTKVKIEIDFGQAVSFWNQDRRLKDQNGKPIKFNSMVDALNFMGAQGWEFVQAYSVTIANQNVYHYLLKKEVSQEDLNKILEEKDSK